MIGKFVKMSTPLCWVFVFAPFFVTTGGFSFQHEPGVCSFCWNCVARQKTKLVYAPENKVWIGNFNVKGRKTIEHILPKTWHATQFWKISAKRAHPRDKVGIFIPGTIQCGFEGNVIAMATQKLFPEQPHCSSTDNTQLHPDRKPLTSGAEATTNRDRDPGKPPQKEPSVQILEPEYKGYTIIKVEEKHGPLHNAIPCMPLPIAIICCIINIFFPGIGKCDAAIF